MAIASGSRGLEAAVRLGVGDAPDLSAVHDFAGDRVVVHLGDPRGQVTATA